MIQLLDGEPQFSSNDYLFIYKISHYEVSSEFQIHRAFMNCPL